MTDTPTIVQVSGEAKETLDVFGGVIAIHVDGADTANAYSLLQMSAPGDDLPREAFPPAHIHHQEEEAWYILEGTFRFEVGGRTFDVAPGSFVLAPRGTQHTFWATGPQRHRWLTIFSPSGMEGYFREFAHEVHQYQHASREQIQALAQKYQFEFV
jgi:mannose-6-phosphate isomerase-like protein (cupin superfamily)